MNHLLHLELARIRVADDRRFARSWRRRGRRPAPAPALPPVVVLPRPVEVPCRACA